MDSRIERQFYRFLLEQRGYPPDSILVQHYLPRNWGSAKYIPDFTILDPLTRDILAIIEIKSASAVERGDTIERCRRLSEGLATRRIHFFLIFFDESSPEGVRLSQIRVWRATRVSAGAISDFCRACEWRSGSRN